MSQFRDAVDRLIDYTARTESGGDYSAFNPDDNGAGISFGLIQNNQKKGSLWELLGRMHDADPPAFKRIFRGNWKDLLNRLFLATQDLRRMEAQFKKAGQHPPFQQVQRDLAREGYFEPAHLLMRSKGWMSERAVAMAFDIAVQRGIGWLRENVERIISANWHRSESFYLQELAKNADRGLGGKSGRRHKILADPNLSDEPFQATPVPEAIRQATAGESEGRATLRRGDKGEDVRELQRKLSLIGYTIKGWSVTDPATYGPRTEAAVREFQEDHGLTVDGIAGPEVYRALSERIPQP